MAVTHRLPVAKLCEICRVPLSYMPSAFGRPVCLESEPWDRVVTTDKIQLYYLDENGRAQRTTRAFRMEVPLWVCHTSRPGHQHLSRNGGVDYETRIASVEWAKLGEKWKTEDDWRCEECNTKTLVLHVHHKHYDTLGHEERGDVEILCADCHAARHPDREIRLC